MLMKCGRLFVFVGRFCSAVFADELVITDFNQDQGVLIWSNAMATGFTYRIQWSGVPNGPWSQTYGQFEKGPITGAAQTLEVPVRFRVANEDTLYNHPPVQTNLDITITNPAGIIAWSDLLAGFYDPDGHPLYVINSGVGTLALHYTNASGFMSDVLTYYVTDGQGGVAAGRLYIAFTNRPPTALDFWTNTLEDWSVTINVYSNNSDPEGRVYGCVTNDQPADGVVVATNFNAVGAELLIYYPGLDFNGTNSFSYVMANSSGFRSTGAITVVVIPIPDPPTATNLYTNIFEDTFANIDVVSPNRDPEGQMIGCSSFGQPSNGIVSVLQSNAVGAELLRYVPYTNYFGTDTFAYVMMDAGGLSNTGLITVTVAPVPEPPTAFDFKTNTWEDSWVHINVYSNNYDPDGHLYACVSNTLPAHGLVWSFRTNEVGATILEYTPDPDYAGTDTFQYVMGDVLGLKNTGTITVAVWPVNDPPTANDFATNTLEDTNVLIDVISPNSDPEGHEFGCHYFTQPAFGTVTGAISNNAGWSWLNYEPDLNYNGTDTFHYAMIDTNGAVSVTGTITVVVAPVGDGPTAVDYKTNTLEDVAVSVDVVAINSAPEPVTFGCISFSAPAHGSVTGATWNGVGWTYLQYQPDPEWSGTDTYNYVMGDENGDSNTGRMTIVVSPVIDPPTAHDYRTNTLEDVAVMVNTIAINEDVEGLAYGCVQVGPASHGGTAFNATATKGYTNVVYTPHANWHGTDSFWYVMSDILDQTRTGVLTVVVQPINDPPTAVDIYTNTLEDFAVMIDVVTNNYDPESNLFACTSFTQPNPSNGYVVGVFTNQLAWSVLKYSPDTNFYGTNVFSYTMADVAGLSNTGRIFVSVIGGTKPPQANPDTCFTPVNGVTNLEVTANDYSPYGRPLGVTSYVKPQYGSLTNGSGTNASGWTYLIYTPSNNWTGIDTFRYVVSDGYRVATGEVTVTVGNPYLVINVAAGPAAPSYPFVFTNCLPNGWPTNNACKTTNIVLRYIHKGGFMMGSPTTECKNVGAYDETPHSQSVPISYYMSVFEITQSQYSNVMGANPSWFTNYSDSAFRPVEMVTWTLARGGTVHGAVDTNSFVGRLSVRTGLSNNIPTEAEWEYACRAGTTNTYNDNTLYKKPDCTCTAQPVVCSNLDRLAWYYVTPAQTKAVGQKNPNFWGLYDMHGNVSEWTDDSPGGNSRWHRGGSVVYGDLDVRSATRWYSNYYSPDYAVGFRIIVRLSP